MSIEVFDKVLQEYSDAFVAAKDDKEREKVDAKFEKIIDKAEADLEAAFEKQFQAEQEALEKEQKAAEFVDEIELDDSDFNIEGYEDMYSDINTLTEVEFNKKYKLKDIRALISLFKLPMREGGEYIKEDELVSSLYKYIAERDS